MPARFTPTPASNRVRLGTPPVSRFTLAGATLAAAMALAGCATTPEMDAGAVLGKTNAAMGGTSLKSIRFAGAGTGTTFGQAYEPGFAWPKIAYSSFARVADYENASLREDAARSRAEPTGGGAVPLMGQGEQRTTGLLRGSTAWNLIGPAPAPAGVAAPARIHDLWTSPHGIIKAALKNQATAQSQTLDGKPYTAVSFTQPGQFKATAYINADNLVERIDSVMPNAVLGDTAVVTRFSDYKDTNGVKFPMRIRQTIAGTEVLDLQVAEVQINPAANFEVPALVAAATERVAIEKAAEGVWFVGGGSHNSVAIEMKDHLILVESPLFDGRASPVLAEVAKLAPGKPIRFAINSHHHFDHAGGLRTAAAAGAELVTSSLARNYYQQVMANPNSISPDALRQSGKSVTVSGVDGKRVFSDGSRNVEVYYMDGSVHAQGFMMVYLPAEKILIEADAYTPGAPGSAPPARPSDLNVNLVQNIERMKLNVERILPLHGRMVPVSELYVAIGRK